MVIFARNFQILYVAAAVQLGSENFHRLGVHVVGELADVGIQRFTVDNIASAVGFFVRLQPFFNQFHLRGKVIELGFVGIGSLIKREVIVVGDIFGNG